VSGMIATSNRRAVIGAGVTGRSLARFLSTRNIPFDWYDTRKSMVEISMSESEQLDAPLQFGQIKPDQLCGYDEIILSPGIAKSETYITKAQEAGSRVVGDIELFARHSDIPVAAITGSNGKSSVTTLLAEVAQACGRNAIAAGNLGEPVLDQLDRDYDLFVLELSSFQLETTSSLTPVVAVILNMSPDHMDRYPSMIAYHAAKQRIHSGAAAVVSNRDDLLTQPMLADTQRHSSFGFDQPDLGHYGLRDRDGTVYVAHGIDSLFPVENIELKGRHNLANAMAVLAMSDFLGLDRQIAVEVVCSFKGLPHRCELVGNKNDLRWVNDSKATNVGAAVAAIEGLCDEVSGQFILIAGGQTKDQEFADFGKLVSEKIDQLILLGEGAEEIAKSVIAEAIKGETKISFAENMQDAVAVAAENAGPQDCVLLSPACASFDQFTGYQDRGDQFRAAVGALQ